MVELSISEAISQAYQQANLDLAKVKGIVPLFELIRAYPLQVVELNNLNYRTAAEYIEQETGRPSQIQVKSDQALAGFLYVTEYFDNLWGYIFLRKSDPIGRRRFSAAHELGHYLLHFMPLLGKSKIRDDNLILTEGLVPVGEDTEENFSGEVSFSTATGQKITLPTKPLIQMEQEADTFAAELLMPAVICERLVEAITKQVVAKKEVLVKRLMAEMLVSKAAINHRLNNLDLLKNVLKEPSSKKVRYN
jgi:Zn-dependent peptidase ImmA (M78 family)